MATRIFDCENCGSFGKVILKSQDHSPDEIVFCPVCGADIFEESRYEDDSDDNR